MIKKFTSSIVMVAFVVMATGVLNPFVAMAASISTAKATFGRLKASTPSDSVIVQFNSPTGIQTAGDTVTLTFSGDFTLAAEDVNNFDIETGNNTCALSNTWSDKTIALTASATEWGVDVTGDVVTLSPDTDDTLTAGYCIRVEMGTAATTGATGSASTVTNGTADDNDTITISGGFGDTGIMTVDIIDDDQVTVTATVNQTMTFDLDANTSDVELAGPYSVPLGVLSSGAVTVSNGTSINMIIAEGGTNASGGMNVSVRSANGADGLKSTSTPADKIPSATATMSAGTSNYGLCVATAALAGFAKSAGYNTTCALSASNNAVVGLTTTTADILTSTAPLSNAYANIVVNAAIAGAQAAHTDYTDTLTFVATASF